MKKKKIVVHMCGEVELVVPKQLHNNLMNSNDNKIVKQLCRLVRKNMNTKIVFDMIESWDEEDV